MTVIEIDFRNVKSLSDFEDIISTSLKFPYYYGRNINAFWDCLTDILDDTMVNIFNYDSIDKVTRDHIAFYILLMFEYQEKTNRQFRIHLYFGNDLPEHK
ncbi:Barstar, RNAse (barnase) inhibitor [Phyllobacterium sp. YR620]|jgi:ribonuclease inhibitor|nr:Barstar, RNAse (barnase) inhibitor [Phyllobacterium sp. YR620]